MRRRPYGSDLSFIHDAGFGGFARRAAPGLLTILRRNGVARGRVVDLGCGSGVLAAALVRAGHAVIGIDQSAAMIALARRRAPRATFLRASIARAAIPPCDAMTAVGEFINYDFPGLAVRPRALFSRARRALRPGGLLVFDALLPEPSEGPARWWGEGPGWAVLVEKEHAAAGRLTRRIVTYRRAGRGYRRSAEVHRLRLHPAARLASWLESEGFRVRIARAYGRFRLSPQRIVFIAKAARGA